MLPGIVLLTATGFLAGFVLSRLAATMPSSDQKLVDEIDRLLPQTQCAQCGYPGCRPYAAAIASGAAEINRCPPGGDATIHSLANLLGRDPEALDEQLRDMPLLQVAVIDEESCIGCARCIDACPVDAIVGAHLYMHTVLSKDCTGCELCLEPCPVDCISLVSSGPAG